MNMNIKYAVDSKNNIIPLTSQDKWLNLLSIDEQMNEMKDFLNNTKELLGYSESNCIMAIQPFNSYSEMYLLEKCKIESDSELLKKADRIGSFHCTKEEESMLKSIYPVKNNGKTEHWLFRFQPIYIEWNIYDKQVIDIVPKKAVYFNSIKNHLRNGLLSTDDYNRYSESSLMHEGHRLYNRSNMVLEDINNCFERAVEKEFKAGVKDELISQDEYIDMLNLIGNYKKTQSIDKQSSKSNRNFFTLNYVNSNKNINIFNEYTEVKNLLENLYRNVYNIHYIKNEIKFSRDIFDEKEDFSIFVCRNRNHSVNYVYNDKVHTSLQSLEDSLRYTNVFKDERISFAKLIDESTMQRNQEEHNRKMGWTNLKNVKKNEIERD